MLRNLLCDAGRGLASAGLLRLHRLRLGQETVAVLLAMHGDRRTCFYLSGFDPAFADRERLGGAMIPEPPEGSRKTK